MQLPRNKFISLIKGLVAVKLIMLCALLLTLKGKVFWGEILAQAETPSEASAKPSEETSPLKKSADDTSGTDASEGNEKADVNTSQSILDSLLTLPKLDPDKVQKDEIGRYLNLAESAKRQAEDRIAALRIKTDEIKELEDSIEEKIKKLEEEKQFFLKTIQQEKEIQKERLDALVVLFQKMEPKKAAPMLAAMDKDLAVALIKALAPKQVTKIIELMEPQEATQLTEYFGRIGSAREYEVLKEMNRSLLSAFDKCKTESLEPSASADAKP